MNPTSLIRRNAGDGRNARRSALAQGEPIKLVNLLELSGPIASAGINYRDGVDLAVREINAAGGVLGRKFEVTTLDSQSNPGVSKALAQKAIDMGAFAVIGPTFSGSMVVSANETRRGEDPEFHRRRRGVDHAAGQSRTSSAPTRRRPRRCPSSRATSRKG